MITDQPSDVSILNRRIERLERRVRRLSVLAVAVVGVSAGFVGRTVVGGADVVEARRFVLTDAVGKQRAVLAVEPSGAASLYFTDAMARARATLGVGADGAPALGLGDDAGVLRAAI